MKVVRSDVPVGQVVDLLTKRAHGRVWHDDDNDLIEHFIAAATEWVEGACQTVLLRTKFTAEGPKFDLDLRRYPFPSITTVSYVDDLGVTVPVTEHRIVDEKLVVDGVSNIQTATVIFTAGMGEENVPKSLKQAVLMLAESFYRQRADFSTEATQQVPMGVRQLIAHHRSFAF